MAVSVQGPLAGSSAHQMLPAESARTQSVTVGHETRLNVKLPPKFVAVHFVDPPVGSVDVMTLPLSSPATHRDAEGQSMVVIVLLPSIVTGLDHVNAPAAPACEANARKQAVTMVARSVRDRILRPYARNPGMRRLVCADISGSSRRSSSARTARRPSRGGSERGAETRRNRINPQESVPRGRKTMCRSLLRR